MKLLTTNLEQGLQRVYYVAWLLWIGLYWTNYVVNISQHTAQPEAVFAMELLLGVGVTLVLPWIVLVGIRWIYRGFAPAHTD